MAVLLLCILVLPNATPAHAQTPATSQVKNTAQTTDSFWPKLEVNGPVLAQAFTTGNNPGGYQLESIGIRFGGIDDNEAHLINKLALRLETMSGNNPSGTWVTGLAPPFPLQAHAVNYFTASIRLKPNTTYAAVLTHSNRHAFFDGSGGFWVANTSTDAEDTAESGWSIRHNSRRKSNPNSVWVGNPESLMLDIRAEAVAPAPGIVLAATGGIVEDNFLLLGSGENAPLTEAAGPRRSKTFTVKLKQQPAATTTVNLDLQTGPGVVTFSPASLTFTTGTWNSTQTVTVTAVDDSFQDEHKREIFKIHLQAWINGLVADHGFVWGMVDDDETIIPPRIQFVSNMGGKNLELTEAAAGRSKTFTVAPDQAPHEDMKVTLQVTQGTGNIKIDRTSLTFTPAGGVTPQTVTVKAVDDAVYQGSGRSAMVEVTGPNNGFAVSVIVTDDETLSPPAKMGPPKLTAGDNALDVAWEAPNNGGATIFDYHVRYIRTDREGAEWGGWHHYQVDWPSWTPDHERRFWDGNDLKYTIQTDSDYVSNSFTYKVQVKAENLEGHGPWSEIATITLPHRDPPNRPRSLSVRPMSDSRFEVSWLPPRFGPPVEKYKIDYQASNQLVWISTETGGNVLTWGASASLGEGFSVRVRASNAYGDSPWTSVLTFAHQNVPGAVKNVVAMPRTGPTVDPAKPQLEVTWVAPDSNGGSAVTDYHLRYVEKPANPNIELTWSLRNVPKDNQDNVQHLYFIRNLTSGTQYLVQVRAVNAVGAGAWGPSTAMPVTAMGEPQPQQQPQGVVELIPQNDQEPPQQQQDEPQQQQGEPQQQQGEAQQQQGEPQQQQEPAETVDDGEPGEGSDGSSDDDEVIVIVVGVPPVPVGGPPPTENDEDDGGSDGSSDDDEVIVIVVGVPPVPVGGSSPPSGTGENAEFCEANPDNWTCTEPDSENDEDDWW